MGCREVTGDKELGLRVRGGFTSVGYGMVGEVRGKAGRRWTDGGRGSSRVGRRGGAPQEAAAGSCGDGCGGGSSGNKRR
jgi:hypothetical protein